MATRPEDRPSYPKPNSNNTPRRGRVACTFCHVRRTRCDATPDTPCSNCSALGQPCTLIESRRGRYVRKNKHTANQRAWSSTITNDRLAAGRASQPLTATFSINDISGVSSSSFSSFPAGDCDVTTTVDTSEDAAATAMVDTSEDVTVANSISHPQTMSQQNTPRAPILAAFERHSLPREREGSEMLYLRLCESYLSPSLSSTPSGSHRVVYMGESYTFSYLVQEINSPTSVQDSGISTSVQRPRYQTPKKLQWPVPASVDDRARNLGYDPNLEPGELHLLHSVGAFCVLEKSISDQLVKTFFDYVYPVFPIFDRADFARQYNANCLSLLTLNVVYLLAVTMCSDELITQAGFSNRFTARRTFQKRAKALYDVDYETDKIVLITSLFLISFCWNGVMDEKDMWHWLGAAIGLAQAQGMHRSTKGADLSMKDQRLWKRIWWSLYIRDRHSAAALGRPLRIRDEDCDTEMLQESDFEELELPDSEVFGVPSRVHVLAAISFAKLSIVFGQIILVKFTVQRPSMTESEKVNLTERLEIWRRELPRELSNRGSYETSDCQLWSTILDILYSHHLILLHRPNFTDTNDFSAKNIAFTAASTVTRGIESLMISDTLRQAQLHIIPSIFGALAIQVLVIRNSNPIQRKLAENHARLCMFGLSEMAKTWPVCSWVLNLFERLLNDPHSEVKSKAPAATATEVPVSLNSDNPSLDMNYGGENSIDHTDSNPNSEANVTDRQSDNQNDLNAGTATTPLSNCITQRGGVGQPFRDGEVDYAGWVPSLPQSQAFSLEPFFAGDLNFDFNDNSEFLSYLLNQAPPT